MKLSRFLVPTMREAPADADNVSAKLMQRAGMIRKLAAGIYDWLPLGLRVLRKVEKIVREEMVAAGAQEVWLPVIQPKALWVETGRLNNVGVEHACATHLKPTPFLAGRNKPHIDLNRRFSEAEEAWAESYLRTLTKILSVEP